MITSVDIAFSMNAEEEMFYWRGIVKIIIRSRRWGGVIGSSTFRNGQSAQRWRRQALTTEAKRSSGSFATAGHPYRTNAAPQLTAGKW
jgi:hypothetical protein